VNYSLRYFEGWGENYVKEIEKWFGHAISVGGIAEFFPNKDTFVTLDPNVNDQFKTPVARIQSFLGEPELKTLEFISKKSKEILEASGAKEIVEVVSSYDFFSATHVFGTCRMGNDNETSVVNSSHRVHGIPNLLVTDASVFPTSGGGEAPSLTIEALSLRAADLLLKELKKG
jgi:choline dehydrogenase-like flavoprotein